MLCAAASSSLSIYHCRSSAGWMKAGSIVVRDGEKIPAQTWMAPPMNRNKHYYAVHPLMRSSVQIHVRWFFFVVVPMFFPFWYDSDIEHKRKIYAIEISSRWCCKALRWGVGEEPFSPDLLWCLLWNILLFGWQWECCSTAIFSLWKSCRQTTGNIASSVCLSVGLDSFSCDAVSCVMQLSEIKDSPLSQLATK